jgi:hypothetical protein
MVSGDNLNWILKTLDAGGSVPGWTMRVIKETHYPTRVEDGARWYRPTALRRGPSFPRNLKRSRKLNHRAGLSLLSSRKAGGIDPRFCP